MIKIRIIILVFILGSVLLLFPGRTCAQDVELVVDPECQEYLLLKDPDKVAKCNVICSNICIVSDRHCAPNDPENCISLDLAAEYPEVKPTFSSAVNIFGTDLCPTAAGGGADDPFCTLIMVRLVFYAFLSVIMFASLIMGLWVIWERSTAADSPEKVEKAVTIGRNVIVGLAIVFFFLGIVQISALLLGLTGSLFDISIVPQPKELAFGEKCRDTGQFVTCVPPLVCKKPDPNLPDYYCLR